MPVLPDVRPYSLPGHDPTLASPTLRPTAKVVKKLTSTNSPRYDSSLCTSALQQSTRTKDNADSVPGHDPRHRPIAVQSPIKDGKHVHNSPSHVPRNNQTVVLPPLRSGKHARSSLGHVPTSQSPTMPQSVQSQRVSWFSGLGYSQTRDSIRSSESKITSQNVPRTTRSDTVTMRAQNRAVRCPTQTTVLPHVQDGPTSPTISPVQTRPPRRVQSQGALAASELCHRPVILEAPRQPLAILSTRLQSVPKHEQTVSRVQGSTGLFGQSASMVRYFAAQLGDAFSETVLAFAGAWRSSMSLASWLQIVTYRGLSFSGKNLMSAKKGLQLHRLHTSWSA